MALIASQPKERPETMLLKLDHLVSKRLAQYAAFIQSSKHYVVAQALERVFRNDKAFLQWVAEHPDAPPRDDARGRRATSTPPADGATRSPDPTERGETARRSMSKSPLPPHTRHQRGHAGSDADAKDPATDAQDASPHHTLNHGGHAGQEGATTVVATESEASVRHHEAADRPFSADGRIQGLTRSVGASRPPL